MKTRLGLNGLLAALAAAAALGIAGCGRMQDSPATATTTVGTEIDDSIVSARVAAALLNELAARSYGFKVETRKGEVQLSGFSASQADIDRALQVVRAVPGVKNVDNKVSVKSEDATVGARVDDGIVTARVKSALFADPGVKGIDVAVVTRKGEVQLSGFVDNQAQIDRAVEIARGIEGVRAVSNQMSIKQ